jgi:hypothetical protein
MIAMMSLSIDMVDMGIIITIIIGVIRGRVLIVGIVGIRIIRTLVLIQGRIIVVIRDIRTRINIE